MDLHVGRQKRYVERSLVFAVVALALITGAPSAQARSRSARAEFQRQQPCPSTGAKRGACPGWVVDHIHPLCAGGIDDPSNMAWMEVEEAKRKDRAERGMCRR